MNTNHLSSQFFSLASRNYLWAGAAALSIAGMALLSSTVMFKHPLQKLFLCASAAGCFGAALATRHQYRTARDMYGAAEGAAMMGWAEQQVKMFAPIDQRMDNGAIEVEAEELGDEWAEETMGLDILPQRVALAMATHDIRCNFLGMEEWDDRIRMTFALPPGCTVRKIQGLAVDIAARSGIDAELEVSPVPGGIAIDLMKEVEHEDPIGTAIIKALSSYGIKAKITRSQKGLAFTRYYVEPHKGVKAKDIVSKSQDLMVALGFTSEPIISAQSGAVAIDVPSPKRVFAKYEDYITKEKKPGLCIPIGVDQLTGELIWLDFTDSNCPHILVGGATGGGKSELLRAITASSVQMYPKNELQLLLIDTKKSSFTEFKDCPHLIGGGVATRPVLAAAAMIKMVKVVESRQEKREQVGAKDLATYNKKVDKPLPRILILVEEVKDVLDALKMVSPADLEQLQDVISESMGSEIKVGHKTGEMKPRDVLLLAIDRIAQIGRSEGVHLIIATQDPDKKLLDTIISNLPVQIGLKTRSDIESGTLMPNANADCHKLLGKGDLYLNVPGQPLQRLQSLFADESVIEVVVSNACGGES